MCSLDFTSVISAPHCISFTVRSKELEIVDVFKPWPTNSGFAWNKTKKPEAVSGLDFKELLRPLLVTL
jgi:hypothetical protein